MDLAEMMKTIMAKEAGANTQVNTPASSGVNSTSSPANLSSTNVTSAGTSNQLSTPGSSTGYVTEKLYMLLQLYLQNKGWNSVELLQCFADLKEASMIPNPASYFQMMASRIALDSQGRLVHRENGKIILPFEHFANAVMLKHMNGPHGLHLSLEGTIRAVVESYTIGRDYFGMEKEFIVEVVENCLNPACRFYHSKLHLGSSSSTYHPPSDSSDPTAKSSKNVKDVLPNAQRQHQDYKSSSRSSVPQSLADAGNLVRTGNPSAYAKSSASSDFSQVNLTLPSLLTQTQSGVASTSTGVTGSAASSGTQNGSSTLHNNQHHQLLNQHHSRETTAQLLKNNLSMDLATQSVGDLKTVNAMLELSRAKAAAAAAAAAVNIPNRNNTPASSRAQLLSAAVAAQQQQLLAEKVVRNLQQEKQQYQQQIQHQQIQLQIQQLQQQQIQQQQQKLLQQKLMDQQQTSMSSLSDHKLADFLRANLDNMDNLSNSNKDLLALHNGAWSTHDEQSSFKRSSSVEVGQEKIVRAFQEIMKNMQRMKMCVRPSMCKPYGKQSEMLQKTLDDTVLLVQALRSLLPPPQY